ncbi:uncharacterized protein EHS24_007313 [Apiotrichum porosum]|uniref:Uncharacterized protein n=1 Tax=Apiotrichum porosum TaxID=105984 RepID=A0A427XTT1_9TREE|nr:uncharacterized protein EHS24_007313 [Apiotrichum porosum]RSH82346.1 hypothetical protein EHS24_007313 [Apiotrichum porosum]
MSGRQGGKAKPLKAPKKEKRELDDDDIAHQQKLKKEAAELKALAAKAYTNIAAMPEWTAERRGWLGARMLGTWEVVVVALCHMQPQEYDVGPGPGPGHLHFVVHSGYHKLAFAFEFTLILIYRWRRGSWIVGVQSNATCVAVLERDVSSGRTSLRPLAFNLASGVVDVPVIAMAHGEAGRRHTRTRSASWLHGATYKGQVEGHKRRVKQALIRPQPDATLTPHTAGQKGPMSGGGIKK